MKEDNGGQTATGTGLHGRRAAIQVICLGSGGGPSEDNVTAFLVRSTISNWAKGSLLAVDAGSHLAPITKILERHFPRISDTRRKPDSTSKSDGSHAADFAGDAMTSSLSPSPSLEDEPQRPQPTTLTSGPFAGLQLTHASARANALEVLKSYISTYLITHPHLDHISGFTINTAAFAASTKPKTLAALPSTVDAIKRHIFNDVIWPNLTDEDGGVGFVTFQRLKEGGDPMVGEGGGRGYIDVCDGLGVKAFKVSHGVCTKSPPAHQHRGSITGIVDSQLQYNGSAGGEGAPSMQRTLSMGQHSQFSAPGTPGFTSRQSLYTNQPSPHVTPADKSCVVDSTAFFVRECETQREVLIFGDVEPDSISLSPRTHIVWQEAARKIAQGHLGGIFIESSYDDGQDDKFLFGHLSPRHLLDELHQLAEMVIDARTTRILEHGQKKRKRSGPNGLEVSARHAVAEQDWHQKRSRSLAGGSVAQDFRRSSVPDRPARTAFATQPSSPIIQPLHQDLHNSNHEPISPKSVTFPHATPPGAENMHTLPLSGVRVVVIHVKDTLKDGPHASENILAQLQEREQELHEEGKGLGCEFVIAQSGESYWF